MKYQFVVLAALLLSIGICTKQVVHYSVHFTLEHALAFDTTELNTPECLTAVEIDGKISALEEWVELLQNPEDLQTDIGILLDVRELIVQAKDSIETVGGDFDSSITGFAQVRSQSKVTLQTQIVHRVFADQMEQILAQLETLNANQGSVDELVALSDSILEAIDNLITELQDLQADQDNFAGYIETLVTTVTTAKSIRETCHSEPYPGPTPSPSVGNLYVSSATLDDFEPTPGSSTGGDGQQTGGDSQDNNQDNQQNSGDFVPNSGQLQFVQKKANKNEIPVVNMSQVRTPKNRGYSRKRHLSTNYRRA